MIKSLGLLSSAGKASFYNIKTQKSSPIDSTNRHICLFSSRRRGPFLGPLLLFVSLHVNKTSNMAHEVRTSRDILDKFNANNAKILALGLVIGFSVFHGIRHLRYGKAFKSFYLFLP